MLWQYKKKSVEFNNKNSRVSSKAAKSHKCSGHEGGREGRTYEGVKWKAIKNQVLFYLFHIPTKAFKYIFYFFIFYVKQ